MKRKWCLRLLLAAALLAYADLVARGWVRAYSELTAGCALRLALLPRPSAEGGCPHAPVAESRVLKVRKSFLHSLSSLPEIPRVVHIAWKSAPALPPPGVFTSLCVRRLISLNRGWKVRLYNDTEIETYLREALPAEDAILLAGRHIVEKVDLWRLLIIFRHGGVYMDADRWATRPLDEVISSSTRMLLPTFADAGPSQDFMASAPGNPVFRFAISLNLERRRSGKWSLYEMGPVTWEHAVARVIFGTSGDRGSARGKAMRAAIDRSGPPCLLKTQRESPPCETMTTDVLSYSGLACVLLWPLFKRSKARAYEHVGAQHWAQVRFTSRKRSFAFPKIRPAHLEDVRKPRFRNIRRQDFNTSF